MRRLFRALSIAALIRAIFRGPGPLARNRARAHAHRSLARFMRRSGL